MFLVYVKTYWIKIIYLGFLWICFCQKPQNVFWGNIIFVQNINYVLLGKTFCTKIIFLVFLSKRFWLKTFFVFSRYNVYGKLPKTCFLFNSSVTKPQTRLFGLLRAQHNHQHVFLDNTLLSKHMYRVIGSSHVWQNTTYLLSGTYVFSKITYTVC